MNRILSGNILVQHLLSVLLLSLLSYQQLAFCQKEESFNEKYLSRHLQFLASDLFEGRGTGTMGGNLAAKYIALEFTNYKLLPFGSSETYYQYVPMHGSIPLPASELQMSIQEDTFRLKLKDDYLLYSTGEQTFIPSSIPLVFVGFGIIAPEFDYNDYQSVDVEGKIAVFLEGEPYSSDDSYFDGENPTIYSLPESKQRIAISRGAAGSILIPLVNDDKYWQNLSREFSFEDVYLAYSVANNLNIILNPKFAEKLFTGSGFELKNIYHRLQSGGVESFEMNATLSFKGLFKERDFLSPNIIGMVKGNDPKLSESYIIVSAHYDHLGIGPTINGDSIYNGLLDNAMGVAGLLELARRISNEQKSFKRSVIFIALTGEEKGLLGSTFYVQNPAVPLYKTVTNINIDGMALFADFASVIGVGAELSDLQEILKKTTDKLNIELVSIPKEFRNFEAFSKSDQVAFAQAGIPSILILEGPTNKNYSTEFITERFIEYSENFYHTPFDDLNIKISTKAMVQHLDLIYNFLIEIANSETEPGWKPGTQFINARLRSIAEKR
jgi:hypothetical protein